MKVMEVKPKVSVCVVSYNQEEYIVNCLRSILSQDVDFDFEVIVGDDCSTDKTAELVREISCNDKRVHAVIREENIGPYVNYVETHKLARGEYIFHMDGDDYALPGKLEAQVRFLDLHPEYSVVWHRVLLLRNDGFMREDSVDCSLLPANGFQQCDLLAIGTLGKHSSKCYRSSSRPVEYPDQFLDFYVDVENMRHGKGYVLNSILGVYRVGVGISSGGDRTRRILTKILELLISKYPQYRNQIGAFLIKILIGDIVRFRSNFWLSSRIYLLNSPFLSLLYFCKYFKYMKILKD